MQKFQAKLDDRQRRLRLKDSSIHYPVGSRQLRERETITRQQQQALPKVAPRQPEKVTKYVFGTTPGEVASRIYQCLKEVE